MVDIATAITDSNVELSFKVAISETNQKLLLQKQEAQITIPDLNGYSPTEVTVLDKNVEYDYNTETKILTITRRAETNENGAITKSVARSNINNVTIKYPLEAYDQMEADSIVLSIPVVGYNYGYKNPNEEFENPHVSTAEEILTVTYSKPTSGDVWNIYASVGYIYQVSKEVPTNIYNGNVYEDETTTYPVKWEAVIGDYTAINKITLEEQKENENNKSDRFLNTSNKYTSMYDYIKTTGVYFTNASSTLGNDGWIKLYNAETGSLLETFTSSTWGSYTKDKPYAVDLKSIKIETSAPIANTTFSVYQIKEMDDKLLTDTITQEEFEKLAYIYTYLKGQIQAPDEIMYNNGTDTSEINKLAYAYYDAPYSVAKITVAPTQITNQKTEQVDFIIETSYAYINLSKKWKNGVFLIELPEDIINVKINSVEISNKNVKIASREVIEENGKLYIKIYTNNEVESVYTITINADITGDPLKPTETQTVKLYAYNEYCDNYYNETRDIYDIDADGKTDDNIGYATTNMTLIAPSGLITTEYVTNYDDLGSTTIAPNIAEIEKSDETKTATINVSVTNNYIGTISDIVILGKIPFKGNTYVLNQGSLNSQYTANMTGEITVPEKLQEYITVYYSTKENPSKDINDQSNEWKQSEEITDWSAIRTYLIDFGEYKLEKEENKIFTYEVNVPSVVKCNSVTYSDHAVYYDLDTENGKLAVKTEPNKVGIQIILKYNMQLTKKYMMIC